MSNDPLSPLSPYQGAIEFAKSRGFTLAHHVSMEFTDNGGEVPAQAATRRFAFLWHDVHSLLLFLEDFYGRINRATLSGNFNPHALWDYCAGDPSEYDRRFLKAMKSCSHGGYWQDFHCDLTNSRTPLDDKLALLAGYTAYQWTRRPFMQAFHWSERMDGGDWLAAQERHIWYLPEHIKRRITPLQHLIREGCPHPGFGYTHGCLTCGEYTRALTDDFVERHRPSFLTAT